ncbi:hypothetical protein VP01_10353g1, partial [Puccinia sorghi]
HLLNIMKECFWLKNQPRIWNEEILITLPKPGQDQNWLKNTRGITLSCTEGKLLLTIIAREISSKLKASNFFSKAQAGF